MNKITAILFIVCVLAIGSAFVLYNANAKNKAELAVMSKNYKDLERDNKNLSLSYKELNERQASRIKELADSLKIKPKFIDRYIDIHTYDTITDTIPVPVVVIDTNEYSFKADTGCFVVEGLISTKSKIPEISLTKLQYVNQVEYLLYMERREWKFIFWKTRFLGKKERKLKVISKCGDSHVEDIELIKK